MAFVLAALLPPSAGDASLDGDDDGVKKSIILAIPMATSYRPHSIVNALVVAASDRRDLHGVQQPPGPGAVAQANAAPHAIP